MVLIYRPGRSRANTYARARRRYARSIRTKSIGYARYKRGPNSRYYKKSLPALATELKIYDSYCGNQIVRKGAAAGSPTFGWTNGTSASFCVGSALNAVAAGDGYFDRDGNIIAMKSIHCKIVLRSNAQAPAGPAADPHCFIALVLDRQPNTVLCNSEEIFQNPSNTLQGSTQAMQISALSRRRFKILKSAYVRLNRHVNRDSDSNTDVHSSGLARFEWFVDLKGRKTIFVGATASISAIQTNALFLVAFGHDESNELLAGDASNVLLTHNTRLRFVG